MPPESPSGEPDDRAVRDRLDAIRREKRPRVRWDVSPRTAELTLNALGRAGSGERRPSSKSRRRKRHKRLL
jgi:hypothetical protein